PLSIETAERRSVYDGANALMSSEVIVTAVEEQVSAPPATAGSLIQQAPQPPVAPAPGVVNGEVALKEALHGTRTELRDAKDMIAAYQEEVEKVSALGFANTSGYTPPRAPLSRSIVTNGQLQQRHARFPPEISPLPAEVFRDLDNVLA